MAENIGKAGAILVAGACGIAGFLAMAVVSPNRFDYAAASEERQQQYLDNIAKGFKGGFNATSGGNAEIKRISASAGSNSISVDIQFTRKEIERAPASAIQEFRNYVYKYNCAFLEKKSVLDQGVTLKIRMTKPSGAPLTNFTINREGCRPYLKAA